MARGLITRRSKVSFLSRDQGSSSALQSPTLGLKIVLEELDLLGTCPFVRPVQAGQEGRKSLGDLMQRHKAQRGANGLVDQDHHPPCLTGET